MQSCRSTNLLKNTTAAPETIAINEDIVTEILIRVPVKPLLRFKCVSKRWLSLISDPRFCRRHHHHHHRLHRTSLSGIFLSRRTPSHFQFVPLGETRTRPPFTTLDFITARDPTTSSGLKISHSCNGLLLCRSVNKTLADQCHCYYVCNPVTRQFSTLPRLSSEGPITIFGLSLAFEPTESPYYRVVCVRSSDVSDYFYQLEVYSSETHAWRPRISPFVAQSDMVFDNGVFWNGGIHWLSPSGAGLCFDIEEEILGVMPSAPVSEGCADRRPGYFGASGGHLHLVEAYGSGTTRFKIFEMERDYTRWFVKYEVDLGALVVDFPETVLVRDFIKSEYTYYAYIGVCVVRRKDSSILLLHIPGKIISYNLEDKSFKKLRELTPHHRNETVTSLQSQFGWLEAFQYTETLACV